MPLASTPQLGATLLSQRRCTFTLHTDTHTHRGRVSVFGGAGSGECRPPVTFTLESLSQEAPQQRAAVVAEGQNFEVVDAELVRHVDAEPLRTDRLQEAQKAQTRLSRLRPSHKDR